MTKGFWFGNPLLPLMAFLMLMTGQLSAQGPQVDTNGSTDEGPYARIIRHAGMSMDGTRAFAGYYDRVIRVWDVPGRKLLRTIDDNSTNQNTIPSYAFSRDGRFAVVGNDDFPDRWGMPTKLDPATLTFWDLSTGNRIRAFPTGGDPVLDVALSPDGKWALSVNVVKRVPAGNPENLAEFRRVRAVRLWNTGNGKLVRTLFEETNNRLFGPVTFTPDGKLCATVVSGPIDSRLGWPTTSTLKLWDTVTGQVVSNKVLDRWTKVACVTFSPDGKSVAVGYGNAAAIFDVVSGKLVWYYWEAKTWSISSLTYSPDAKSLLACGTCGQG